MYQCIGTSYRSNQINQLRCWTVDTYYTFSGVRALKSSLNGFRFRKKQKRI